MGKEVLGERDKLVDQAAQRLSEHFDSVVVIATTHGEGGTFTYCRGRGNVYAQIGSVQEWLQRTTALDIPPHRDNNDDEGEDDGSNED